MTCMTLFFKKALRIFLAATLLCGLGANTGCASGGYKLTRRYATFVNHQNIIIRIVLYILTSIVFVATLLIDAVVFNTIDFWEGRVSANDYSFEKDGKMYLVKHYYLGEKKLRNTEIEIYSKNNGLMKAAEKSIHLAETETGQVQIFEDGALKETIDSIYQLKMSEPSLKEDLQATQKVLFSQQS